MLISLMLVASAETRVMGNLKYIIVVHLRAQSPSPGLPISTRLSRRFSRKKQGLASIRQSQGEVLDITRWLRIWTCRAVEGGPLAREFGERLFLSGHALDRHLIHGHLTDSREKAFWPSSIGRPVSISA